MEKKQITRRMFLAGSAAAVASGTLAGRAFGQQAPAQISTASPNEKLNIAAIGAGGKGRSDINGCRSENVVALCDVDWNRGAQSFEVFPDAKKYKDFRKMLEEMKEIDAVTISTPDHMHAPAALMAMALGKHVYVQKPLTHTPAEARLLTLAARKYKVATQMGNQGHSDEGCRQVCEMVWRGDIGQVREAHIWTNRPVWPQGITELLPEQPVPDFLDWDLWLGVAPKRPFGGYYDREFAPQGQHPVGYAPFAWRGWWDYGCGALGDMACHIMDAPNWALGLGYPTSVEVVSQEGNNELTGPTKSVIRYEFPERTVSYPEWGVNIKMIPVTVYWHDGGNDPKPEDFGLPADTVLGDKGRNGSLLVGEKGFITAGEYGGNPRLLPDSAMKDYKFPDPIIPRVEFERDRHYLDWITACKGGRPACSNFDYAGPFTEVVVLGNLALLSGQKVEWDGPNLKVTNLPEAQKYVHKQYPAGWGMDEMVKELGLKIG
jgi:predicted dehydrogenase